MPFCARLRPSRRRRHFGGEDRHSYPTFSAGDAIHGSEVYNPFFNSRIGGVVVKELGHFLEAFYSQIGIVIVILIIVFAFYAARRWLDKMYYFLEDYTTGFSRCG